MNFYEMMLLQNLNGGGSGGSDIKNVKDATGFGAVAEGYIVKEEGARA